MLVQLTESGRQSVIEASSSLGRKWLSIIPFYQALYLSDFGKYLLLSTSETLHTGFWVSCQYCGDENELGHDEVCVQRQVWMVARRELVKRQLLEPFL